MSRRLKLANATSAGTYPVTRLTPCFLKASRTRAGDGTQNGGGGGIPRNGSPETLAPTVIKHRRNSGGAGGPYTSGATCPPPQRGGARNNALRQSDHLTPGQVENLLAGIAHAALIGLPLSRHTTVSWKLAGVTADLAALGRLLKLWADWLRLQGVPLTVVWVREWGRKFGNHVHILLHLPADLVPAFNAMMRRWRKLCGAAWAAKVVKSRPVGLSLRHAERGVERGETYAEHLAEIAAYLAKGAKPETIKNLGLGRLRTGRVVVGKRCGTSQNIGRKARDCRDSERTLIAFNWASRQSE